MRKEFQTAMYSVGVLHHYYGYSYFEDAVLLVVKEPERLQSIQKEIYLPIANKYCTNVANVEKNIRTIRDVFMKNGGGEILTQLTGCQFWRDKNLIQRS